MFHSRALLLSWLVGFTAAKDIHLDWNITWVWAAPDGFGRPMIGINNEWPCPIVNADLGDRLIVDVHNGLGNQSTGIHWHGFHQYMTGTMDGSNQVTQCALPPGSSMRYEFDVNQTGTYWYHSHEMGQYPDGLRGPFIVRDPSPPFAYDDEFTLTLTDHYHEQMSVLLQQYEADSVGAQAGVNEPLPAAALINEGFDTTTLRVEPNKTYLIHLVCVGNWPGHVIVFDDHEISVVEVDGTWVDAYPARDKKIRLATGQRMSILLKTKDNTDRNYAIWDSMDVNMMFFYQNRAIPEGFNPNTTAWLVYDEAKELPPAPDVHELDPNNDFVDDLVFVPASHESLLEKVDRQIIFDTGVTQRDGRSVYTINGQTYVDPEEPTLYTALAASPENASNASIYGQVNPFVVQYGEVVEIIINNHHGNLHPWHMHGHQFQVLQRTIPEGGYFDGYFANISSTPVKRDTIMVQNHGHAVLRFRANNPDKLPSALGEMHTDLSYEFGSSTAISNGMSPRGSPALSSKPRRRCIKFPYRWIISESVPATAHHRVVRPRLLPTMLPVLMGHQAHLSIPLSRGVSQMHLLLSRMIHNLAVHQIHLRISPSRGVSQRNLLRSLLNPGVHRTTPSHRPTPTHRSIPLATFLLRLAP
ncbi:hypothetical protein brown 1 [Aspergillus fumigatus]|nr:hypothetical protein brown 1 [Aspergillus fumigatus]